MDKDLTQDFDLEAMPCDDLWRLHQDIARILAKKIKAEKIELDDRLAQLSMGTLEVFKTDVDRPRRKYPKVMPQYSNPENPTETWSGRGKQPRWFASALQSGRNIAELRIANKFRCNKQRSGAPGN